MLGSFKELIKRLLKEKQWKLPKQPKGAVKLPCPVPFFWVDESGEVRFMKMSCSCKLKKRR